MKYELKINKKKECTNASQLCPKHSFIITFEQLYIIVWFITNKQTIKLENRKQ